MKAVIFDYDHCPLCDNTDIFLADVTADNLEQWECKRCGNTWIVL